MAAHSSGAPFRQSPLFPQLSFVLVNQSTPALYSTQPSQCPIGPRGRHHCRCLWFQDQPTTNTVPFYLCSGCKACVRRQACWLSCVLKECSAIGSEGCTTLRLSRFVRHSACHDTLGAALAPFMRPYRCNTPLSVPQKLTITPTFKYVSRFTGLSPCTMGVKQQWLRFQHVSAYSLRKTSGNTKD